MESGNEALLKTLTAETQHVYNYLLRQHPREVSLAELSNHLGLTKPTVLHHIEKLKRVDLVEQVVGGYKVKEIVRISVIKGYSNIIRQTLAEWLPVTMLCLAWLVLSIITGLPAEVKLASIVMSIGGIFYSLKKVWKTM